MLLPDPRERRSALSRVLPWNSRAIRDPIWWLDFGRCVKQNRHAFAWRW